MNRKKLMSFEDKTWDAHRLIWAIAELRNEDSNALYENSDNFIVQVHQQRIYSVLCALYNLEYNKAMMSSIIMQFTEGWMLPDINKTDIKTLAVKLTKRTNYRVAAVEKVLNGCDKEYIFKQLMNERLAAERFDCRNNSLVSATFGHSIATRFSDNIYSYMDEANKKLEDVIVLLLGDKGMFIFTESELIGNYHYPKTTDGGLLDYYVDNILGIGM